MSKLRKLAIFGGSFVLYNVISGGGLVIQKYDSLAAQGIQLTDGVRVYFNTTPTTKQFFVPFVFYYFRETYPFRIRPVRSTTGGYDRRVVVTEVLYHRTPDDAQPSVAVARVKVSSWNEIVISEPGEWIVESRGYVETKDGEKRMLSFPTMTIREKERGRIRLRRFIEYVISGAAAF